MLGKKRVLYNITICLSIFFFVFCGMNCVNAQNKTLKTIKINELISKLEKANSRTEKIITAYLLRKGKPALKKLESNLKEKDPSLRKNSAKALGLIGLRAYSTVPSLINSALRDINAKVREAAAKSAVKIYPKSILVFGKTLNYSKNPYLRITAAQAIKYVKAFDLNTVQSLLIAIAKDNTQIVRKLAQKDLDDLGTKAAAALLFSLKHKDKQIKNLAAVNITKMKEKALPYLKQGLTYKRDYAIRVLSAQMIDYMKLEKGVPALVKSTLTDAHPLVKDIARKSIINMGDKSVPYLTKMANQDKVPLKLFALGMFAQIGTKAAAAKSSILEALKSNNVKVKQMAGIAYQKITGMSVTQNKQLNTLSNNLANATRSDKEKIADNLAKMGINSTSGIPYIVNSLAQKNQRDRRVQQKMFNALTKMGHQAVPALQKLMQYEDNLKVREGAVKAAANMGEKAKAMIPALIKALGDRHRVSRHVPAALNQVTGGNAMPYLLKALESKDPKVRKGAAKAIQQLQRKRGYTLPELEKKYSNQ